MNTIEWTYLIYAAASITMTVWVASTLHRNGKVFLIDAFHGNTEIAASVNHLLVVGFYLINIGFVSLFLKTSEDVLGLRSGIEFFSGKFGVVMVVLGLMHFFNLYLFARMRRRAGLPHVPPPVPPTGQLY
ncbi:MAG: hypothetical protein ACFCUX_01050 [Candidatus Methylacidiphilales bacterium]